MTSEVLLDANVLIALSFSDHSHHPAAQRWFGAGRNFATTPTVQGALVRYTMRVATATHAAELLVLLASHPRHQFWPDDRPFTSSVLRGLVGHRQVTHAYLCDAAEARGARLATFDEGLAQLRPRVVELIT